jgi:hypothetical protein
MPMKSIPIYMHTPKAHKVAIAALKFPRRPSQGFDRTQSVIMQVTTEKRAIMAKVDEKYGITDLVFFSSSWSKVLEANRAILMCLNRPSS